MHKVVAQLGDEIVIESVVESTAGGEPEHHYRVRGGLDDGRVFRTLVEVTEYARRILAEGNPELTT
jgi:hypothetical protein